MATSTHSTPHSIVIVAAARTPVGGFQGVLSHHKVTELGSFAINAVLTRAGISPEEIDEVLMGCVLPAGTGQSPARQAALGAGLSMATPATTINKVCGSGMKSVMLAASQLRNGEARTVIAGGMESMSNAPYLMDKVRKGLRIGHHQIKDHMFTDGLEDAYEGLSMGVFAQQAADRFAISREMMDDYALTSLERARKATADGL